MFKKKFCKSKIRASLIRGFAGFMAALTVVANTCNVSFAAGQSKYLGTRAANGSPLIGANFTTDNWDSWEMLCFGVFLSNFCEPFVDDYGSAFSREATAGSQGAGLEALQFSTGGDSQSQAYLQDMLSYCINTQTSREAMRQINVKYKVYEYGELQTDGDLADLGSRKAYLDDLIPVLQEYDGNNEIEVGFSSIIQHPTVSYQQVEVENEGLFGDNNQLKSKTTVARYAVLPQFFVGNGGNTVIASTVVTAGSGASAGETTDSATAGTSVVFDLSNGYDINMLQALLAKAFNEELQKAIKDPTEQPEDGEEGTLNNLMGQKHPLYMDPFGNICIQQNGRYVVVVPSSANCNITTDERFNFVNSLIVDNFILTESDNKVIAHATADGLKGENDFGGNPVGSQSVGEGKLQSGKVLVTTTTMTRYTNAVYEALRDKTTTPSERVIEIPADAENLTKITAYYDDTDSSVNLKGDSQLYYHAGQSVLELISDDPLRDSSIQLAVTGVHTHIWETAYNFLIFKDERIEKIRALPVTMVSLQLLSNAFPTNTSVEKLTDIIQYDAGTTTDQTQQPLFEIDSSYYLTPHSDAWVTNDNQLFNNYALKALNDTIKVDAENITFNRDDYINRLTQATTGHEVQLALLLHKDVTSTDYNELPIEYVREQIDFYQPPASDNKISTMLQGYLLRYHDVHENATSTFDKAEIFANLYAIDNGMKPSYRSLAAYPGVTVDEINNNFYLSDYRSPAVVPTTNNMDWVVRVLKPAEYFSVASQVFGISEGVQFELYTPQIYISYLDFYGFLDKSKGNHFNAKLFKGSDFLQFNKENFTTAMTEEEMEEETRLNVYRFLSLGSDGKSYRDRLFDSIMESFFVTPFEKSLETDSSIIGEKTALLNLEDAKNNFVMGAILNNWSRLSITLFGVLFIICIISMLLNRKSFSWIAVMGLSLAASIWSIPIYLEIAPTICNKFINSTFSSASTYWVMAESVRLDKQEEANEAISDDARIQALLSQLNFLDTDSSLMIKLDISRKVINATTEELNYDTIQRNRTLRWLLPSMMRQISAADGSYDYVSLPVTELYSTFANTYNTYKTTDYLSTVYKNNPTFLNTQVDLLPADDKPVSYWGGYKSTSTNETVASNTTKSITRINADTDLTHTQFYMLDGIRIPTPFAAPYSSDGKSLTMSEWYNMASNVQNDWAVNAANPVSNPFAGHWKSTVEPAMTEYNKYQMAQPQAVGYLSTTEGLGTYFYTVMKDTFKEYETAKSAANLFLNIQGTTAVDNSGRITRQSFMHHGKTGYLRDFLDMEEVFTNVMPYMYQMQTLACGSGETKGALGDMKIEKGNYYRDNYASWAYRCNWVTKIYEDKLYSTEETITYYTYDADGNRSELKTVTIPNPCDPRSYPDDRPMVFSEAQQMAQGLTDEELTIVELKLLNLGYDVEKKFTTLLNYTALDGISTESLYRIMALEAWISFNQTFTNDNVFVTAKTLMPTGYDLRDISFITLFRSMISSITKDTNYMNASVPKEIYENYGLVIMLIVELMVACMRHVFPFARELFMTAQLILCLWSLILNMASSSRNRIESTLGWLMTTVMFTGITVTYYFVLSIFMKNPVTDAVIEVSKLENLGIGAGLLMISIFIIILTVTYAVFLVWFVVSMIQKKHGLSVRDGGFDFFYTLANKAFGGLGSKISHGFSKTTAKMQNLHSMEKKPQEVIIKNKDKDAVHVNIKGGKVGILETGKRYEDNSYERAEDINIGAISDGSRRHHVASERTTEHIIKEIEKGLAMESGVARNPKNS